MQLILAHVTNKKNIINRINWIKQMPCPVSPVQVEVSPHFSRNPTHSRQRPALKLLSSLQPLSHFQFILIVQQRPWHDDVIKAWLSRDWGVSMHTGARLEDSGVFTCGVSLTSTASRTLSVCGTMTSPNRFTFADPSCWFVLNNLVKVDCSHSCIVIEGNGLVFLSRWV